AGDDTPPQPAASSAGHAPDGRSYPPREPARHPAGPGAEPLTYLTNENRPYATRCPRRDGRSRRRGELCGLVPDLSRNGTDGHPESKEPAHRRIEGLLPTILRVLIAFTHFLAFMAHAAGSAPASLYLYSSSLAGSSSFDLVELIFV